jgi:hypothetical protein
MAEEVGPVRLWARQWQRWPSWARERGGREREKQVGKRRERKVGRGKEEREMDVVGNMWAICMEISAKASPVALLWAGGVGCAE